MLFLLNKSFIPEFLCVLQDFSKDTSAEVGCWVNCEIKVSLKHLMKYSGTVIYVAELRGFI